MKQAFIVAALVALVLPSVFGFGAHECGTSKQFGSCMTHPDILTMSWNRFFASFPELDVGSARDASLALILKGNQDTDSASSLALEPQRHFMNEKTSESVSLIQSNLADVLKCLSSGAFASCAKNPWTLLGTTSHTAQDFYAHSNWVELKTGHIADFSKFNHSLCHDISGEIGYACTEGSLTVDGTAYAVGIASHTCFTSVYGVRTPLTHQCSHGGSNFVEASWGMNKDGTAGEKGTRADLHMQAALMAVDHTVKIFTDLYKALQANVGAEKAKVLLRTFFSTTA